MIQLGKFVEVGGGVGWVADTNYIYPAHWGWINISLGVINIPFELKPFQKGAAGTSTLAGTKTKNYAFRMQINALEFHDWK